MRKPNNLKVFGNNESKGPKRNSQKSTKLSYVYIVLVHSKPYVELNTFLN